MVGSTATAVGADGIWAVVVDKEGGSGGGAAATSRQEMHESSKDMLNDGASATVIASATQRVSMVQDIPIEGGAKLNIPSAAYADVGHLTPIVALSSMKDMTVR